MINKLLTVFNLLAGGASIIGVYLSFMGRQDPYLVYVFGGIFILTLLISFYVLLVPGSWLEKNVESKIMRYNSPSKIKKDADLTIQKGDIAFTGWGPISIEFHEPFVSPPEVEVINDRGYQSITPTVQEITSHQFLVKRESISAPGQSETYKWVARGICLQKKTR